jgi:hypothetical protein
VAKKIVFLISGLVGMVIVMPILLINDLAYDSRVPSAGRMTFNGLPVVRYGWLKGSSLGYSDGPKKSGFEVTGPCYVMVRDGGRTRTLRGFTLSRTTYLGGSEPGRLELW